VEVGEELWRRVGVAGLSEERERAGGIGRRAQQVSGGAGSRGGRGKSGGPFNGGSGRPDRRDGLGGWFPFEVRDAPFVCPTPSHPFPR
jgi:hypothetical protein